MAIYLYYGKIGDGKTYHVIVNELLPALRKGRKVYTNLDGLQTRRLSQYIGRDVDIVEWSTVEEVRKACQIDQDDKEGVSLQIDRGSMVVIDEAQMIWDARGWKDTGQAALRLFEYHRHFGLDFVLVTQSPGRLDKAVVRLANEALHVKNLRFLGSAFGKRYVINVRQTPWDREPMATIRGKFDSSVFGLYRSSVLNVRARVTKGATSITWLMVPAVIALVLVMWIRNGGLNVMHGKAGKVVMPNEAVASGPAPVVASSVPVVSSAVSEVSRGGDEQLSDEVEDLSVLPGIERRPKRKAVMLGNRTVDDMVEYYLRVGDGMTVTVSSGGLEDYELVGKL